MTYLEIKQKVLNGCPFVINFAERTLKLGKELVDIEVIEPTKTMDEILQEIFILYQLYKHSIPSEHEPSHPYFKALKYEDLSYDDEIFADCRELARFELEYFILENLLNGSFVWKEELGKWFWQCPNDKDLVILRSWVENEQKQ